MPSLAEAFPDSTERLNYVEAQPQATLPPPGPGSDPQAAKIAQALQLIAAQQAQPAAQSRTPMGMPSVMDVSKQTGLPPWLLYVPGGQSMAQGILGNQQTMSQMQAQAAQTDLARQRFDREGYTMLSDSYITMSKMPPKLRKFYIGKMAEQYQALGHPMDPDYIKTLQSMTDEEIAAQGAWMKEIGQLVPGIGLEAYLGAAMNPESAFKGVELVQNLRKQQMEMRQQLLLQQALDPKATMPDTSLRLTPQGITQGLPQSAIPRIAPERGAGGAVVPSGGITGSNADIKTQVSKLAVEAAQRHGVPPALVLATIERESGFNPNARGADGEYGLMQLMPGTAATLGVPAGQAMNPAVNIDAGVRLIKNLLNQYGGDAFTAMRAYNGGPGGVTNPQTAVYARNVLSSMPRYAQANTGQQSVTDMPERSASGLGTGADLEAAIQKNYAILQRLSHPAIAMTDAGRAQAARVQAQLQMLLTQRDKESLPPDPEFARFAMSRGYPTPQSIPLAARQQEALRFEQWRIDQKEHEERVKQRVQREETPVPQPSEVGPAGGVPVGTTYGETQRMQTKGTDTRQWKTVGDTEKKWFSDTDGMYKRLLKIETAARDPKVQKYLGEIWGNPEGWMDRNVLKHTKGLPDDVTRAVAGMALAAAEFRKFYAGTAQSVQETINADPFLPKANEPPATAVNKLRALVEHVADVSNSKRKSYEQITERAPGGYLTVPNWNALATGGPAQPPPAQQGKTLQVTPPQTPRANKIKDQLLTP